MVSLTKVAHISFKPRRRILGYGLFWTDVNGVKTSARLQMFFKLLRLFLVYLK